MSKTWGNVVFSVQPTAESHRCRADEYRCVNGECISERQRCDGIPDCENLEDEQGCGELISMLDRSILFTTVSTRLYVYGCTQKSCVNCG